MPAVRTETYADIVWKQFRRNPLAYGALWGLVPLVLVAIFAPAVASSDPLVFTDGSTRIYPWFRALFTASEMVDFVFNMALVAFPAWVVLAVIGSRRWRLQGAPWRQVIFRLAVAWLGMTLLLTALFGGVKPDPVGWSPGEVKKFLLDKFVLAGPACLLAVLFQIPFWRQAGLTVPARFLVALGQFVILLVALMARYLRPDWNPATFNTSQTGPFFLTAMQFAVVPWLLSLLAQKGGWAHSGLNVFLRVGIAIGQFLVIAAAFQLAWTGPTWRPNNRYNTREFAMEEFRSIKEGKTDKRGIYVPIPYGPARQDLSMIYQPPAFSKEWKPKPREEWKDVADRVPHLLGTDDVGRDVLVRMMYGTRVSITIGFVAVFLYLTIGCLVGAVAGYFGGWIDILANRVIEVVLLFPAFFLILTLVGMIGPNIYIIMIVIGLTGWPTVARLIRGEVLKQRSADYVTAARAMGLSHTRIIFQHILPNSLAPALVAAPFGIATAIITEASLSLLGFGVQPPAPTWGVLLKLAHEKYDKWWLVMLPTIAIFVTVSVFNLIGSGLRDAMDPKLRSTR